MKQKLTFHTPKGSEHHCSMGTFSPSTTYFLGVKKIEAKKKARIHKELAVFRKSKPHIVQQ